MFDCHHEDNDDGDDHSSIGMSEKLCLQWSDFKDNVNSAFERLKDDKEFTDVTLVCQDGQQMEESNVIVASVSPFFEKILQRNKHPHPLIYVEGIRSKDLLAILDFLYFGEANVSEENLIPSLQLLRNSNLKDSLAKPLMVQILNQSTKPEKRLKQKQHRTVMYKTFMMQKELLRSILSPKNSVVTFRHWMRR